MLLPIHSDRLLHDLTGSRISQLVSHALHCMLLLLTDALAQVDDLAWCIMREISKMCYNPVEEDVIRAKNQLKAAILFSQDNLSGKSTRQCSAVCNLFMQGMNSAILFTCLTIISAVRAVNAQVCLACLPHINSIISPCVMPEVSV